MGTSTVYPTPRSRGVQWADSTGTALRRPDGSTAEIGIASCTWAELQAEYPNNGAALLALPAHTMRFVTDWQAFFVRDPTGAFWKNVAPVVLKRLAAKVAHTGTTAETTVFTYTIPAKLMNAYSGLRWRMAVKAGANTGGTTVRLRFDSTSIDLNSCAASASLSQNVAYHNVGATNVGTYMYGLTFLAATTFDTSAAWAFNIQFTLNNNADTTTLHGIILELV